MNIRLLLSIGICVAYSTQLTADTSSFNQQFGVNGYLTSLPLYYKDREATRLSKKQKKRRDKKRELAARRSNPSTSSGRTGNNQDL